MKPQRTLPVKSCSIKPLAVVGELTEFFATKNKEFTGSTQKVLQERKSVGTKTRSKKMVDFLGDLPHETIENRGDVGTHTSGHVQAQPEFIGQPPPTWYNDRKKDFMVVKVKLNETNRSRDISSIRVVLLYEDRTPVACQEILTLLKMDLDAEGNLTLCCRVEEVSKIHRKQKFRLSVEGAVSDAFTVRSRKNTPKFYRELREQQQGLQIKPKAAPPKKQRKKKTALKSTASQTQCLPDKKPRIEMEAAAAAALEERAEPACPGHAPTAAQQDWRSLADFCQQANRLAALLPPPAWASNCLVQDTRKVARYVGDARNALAAFAAAAAAGPGWGRAGAGPAGLPPPPPPSACAELAAAVGRVTWVHEVVRKALDLSSDFGGAMITRLPTMDERATTNGLPDPLPATAHPSVPWWPQGFSCPALSDWVAAAPPPHSPFSDWVPDAPPPYSPFRSEPLQGNWTPEDFPPEENADIAGRKRSASFCTKFSKLNAQPLERRADQKMEATDGADSLDSVDNSFPSLEQPESLRVTTTRDDWNLVAQLANLPSPVPPEAREALKDDVKASLDQLHKKNDQLHQMVAGLEEKMQQVIPVVKLLFGQLNPVVLGHQGGGGKEPGGDESDALLNQQDPFSPTNQWYL